MIGRHHRQVQLTCQRHGGMVVLLLQRLAGTLQLQIKALRKPFPVLTRQHRGLGAVAGKQGLGNLTLLCR